MLRARGNGSLTSNTEQSLPSRHDAEPLSPPRKKFACDFTARNTRSGSSSLVTVVSLAINAFLLMAILVMSANQSKPCPSSIIGIEANTVDRRPSSVVVATVAETGGTLLGVVGQHSTSAVVSPSAVEAKSTKQVVGSDGGAWTAETHLSEYGFNADWGLMEVLESACREIENTRNTQQQWKQLKNPGVPWNGLWKPPPIVDCKVLEIGCGVGIYADALKKDSAKHQRQVFGVEPNPMGGAFNREKGPKQLPVNILENGDTFEYATTIRKKYLNGDSYFDLLYSIEVFEHMPLDRHTDAVRFLAGLSRPGTKLIFGAGKPGQDGIGHIGGRGREEWAEILKKVGFVKNETMTKEAAWLMTEFNHKRNTQVYIYQ